MPVIQYLQGSLRGCWDLQVNRHSFQAAGHARGHQDVTAQQHSLGAALLDQAEQQRRRASHSWQRIP